MKMKRFASKLLCMSIAAIIAIALSGCKNHNEVLNTTSGTVNTVSITETSSSETEAISQTVETESTETTPQTEAEQMAATEESTPNETDAPPQTAETTIAETTLVETTPAETTLAETTLAETTLQEQTMAATSPITESAPPQTTTVKPEETAAPETTAEKASVEKDGSYTTPEDVAEYIHTFGTLPKNFITKSEAKALGWDSSKGNLWDVANGKSIGGDYFGNYEGLLPKANGRKYTECDVNYSGGYRGSERIIFSNDGLIYYTNDHYQTFTQLY